LFFQKDSDIPLPHRNYQVQIHNKLPFLGESRKAALHKTRLLEPLPIRGEQVETMVKA
jgi:hypothetical protein